MFFSDSVSQVVKSSVNSVQCIDLLPIYRDFVNLVSDEEEDNDEKHSRSPSPPPFSPLTPVDEWYILSNMYCVLL